MAYSDEIKHAARRLFLMHRTPDEIATELTLPRSTVYAWISRFNWAEQLQECGLIEGIERRIQSLLDITGKNSLQLKELELLIDRHLKLVAARLKSQSVTPVATAGECTTIEPARRQTSSKAKRKGKAIKNDVSHLGEADVEKWLACLYPFQRKMHDNIHQRTRNILKSRQIGMTYYCAGEALMRAITTG